MLSSSDNILIFLIDVWTIITKHFLFSCTNLRFYTKWLRSIFCQPFLSQHFNFLNFLFHTQCICRSWRLRRWILPSVTSSSVWIKFSFAIPRTCRTCRIGVVCLQCDFSSFNFRSQKNWYICNAWLWWKM